MCPTQLAAAVGAAAAALTEGRTAEEIAVMAAVFTQLGDTMATIAAQQALCESRRPKATAEVPRK